MNHARGRLLLVLDHSAELAVTGDDTGGLLLWPSAKEAMDRLIAAGHHVELAIPRHLDRGHLAAISEQHPGVNVTAVEGLESLLGALETPDVERTVLVAADRQTRQLAATRWGLTVAPHILVGEWLLQGQVVSFVKAATARRPDSRLRGLLPYSVERMGAEWVLIGLVTEQTLVGMARLGATIERLPFDYSTGDCALLRFDDVSRLRPEHLDGGRLIASDGTRVLVALERGDEILGLPLLKGQVSVEMLLPSPELLSAPEAPRTFELRALGVASALRSFGTGMLAEEAPPEAGDLLDVPLPGAAMLEADADRYAGRTPLDGGAPVVSRHVLHADNARVVTALVTELSSLGYDTCTHAFAHNGQTLHNVVAELPGRGYFRIRPDILKKILRVVRPIPQPWPLKKIAPRLEDAIGPQALSELLRLGAGPLAATLEEAVGAYRWTPWTRRDLISGLGAQVIIVGCHLDSTASRTPGGYDPTRDPAPGLDDDASGIAACLGVARYLGAFKGTLTHTVRICFFNAEEQGLVGSKAYAAKLKALRVPVRAVVCLDMLGFESDGARLFEVHAGFGDPSVRDASMPVADLIASWAGALGALEPAQVYSGTSPSSGAPNRSLWDPAINRSDHAAFHQQGYPAVVVSEDYFGNMPGEPSPYPNPAYHSPSDTIINPSYAAAITSAVACAVKELACSR